MGCKVNELSLFAASSLFPACASPFPASFPPPSFVFPLRLFVTHSRCFLRLYVEDTWLVLASSLENALLCCGALTPHWDRTVRNLGQKQVQLLLVSG
jgi:hypothetical protein